MVIHLPLAHLSDVFALIRIMPLSSVPSQITGLNPEDGTVTPIDAKFIVHVLLVVYHQN